ncbi:MAG: 6-phosphofructokinase [Candidatus Melainabacteria bacterium]|jgi:phosphofructokinase-like protein|nr:6-phosphofructokinase [Candidatus Melainabacteria bacterium]MBX9672474.1 6-phosphofructokinase [Candidatus Obscuribacterales bacterium]
MRIGILTGGGDCPGLNAVVRAVVRRSVKDYKSEVVGFLEGFKGPLENMIMPLTMQSTGGLIHRGGTILRTSRTDPFKLDNGPQRIIDSIARHRLDALIVCGGDDTCAVANRLYEEHGVNLVCIPKTIDNDIKTTDFAFGFDTAINIVAEALDRLHTTAESHNRVLVCEVMGRHSGWIACYGGIAGGADFILVPEKPVNLNDVVSAIKQRHARGRDFSILVVSEGARFDDAALNEQLGPQDQTGRSNLAGIGELLARLIERDTGFETRATTLGHIQRGGSPTAFDRVLATRFGVKAADMVHEGKFGQMVALRGYDLVEVPIKEAATGYKPLDMDLYKVSEVFFG